MSSKHGNMSSMGNIKGEVKRAGHKAAFNPLMESLTRLSFGVRGFIYITMGMLALSVVLGKGGTPVDPQGAIAAIGRFIFPLGCLDRADLLFIMGRDSRRIRSTR